jgi:hypothetical protein
MRLVMVKLVLLALVLLSTRARADPRPWADGVSETAQAAALELYGAGNREFAEARYAAALVKYREAIRHWDHPAVHFNIAVCLINLDQPLEAHQHLEKSLAFGSAAVGADAYQQGLTYRKLLAAQLARLAIRCDDPDAQIRVDGTHVLLAEGVATLVVRPGPHQVVATRPGYTAALENVELVAGKTLEVPLVLRPERVAAPARMTRRWPVWKPWAVVAGGSALAGVGLAFYVSARRDLERYDAGIAASCPRGCTPDMVAALGLEAPRDRARWKQHLAFGLFAGGAIGIAGGTALVLANMPRIEVQRDGVAVAWSGRF